MDGPLPLFILPCRGFESRFGGYWDESEQQHPGSTGEPTSSPVKGTKLKIRLKGGAGSKGVGGTATAAAEGVGGSSTDAGGEGSSAAPPTAAAPSCTAHAAGLSGGSGKEAEPSGGSGGRWSLELRVHALPRLLQYIAADEETEGNSSAMRVKSPQGGPAGKRVAGYTNWALKFAQARNVLIQIEGRGFESVQGMSDASKAPFK